ncbi:MAG: alpha/beta hydrolase [Halofilum sp. (in: g-proteobacteria)]|nr:alpha/beta hydrolase [Halofilum sp. (in: g-proteobacteria)]
MGARVAPRARARQSWGRALTDVRVTDDPRVRAIQAGDPLVLEAIRLDMLYGLVELMDAALGRTRALPAATLVLYRRARRHHPAAAGCALLARLAGAAPPRPRLALYPEGYHYLDRDRQRRRTIGDILAWLDRPAAALPSGAGLAPSAARRQLGCDAPQPARKRSGR